MMVRFVVALQHRSRRKQSFTNGQHNCNYRNDFTKSRKIESFKACFGENSIQKRQFWRLLNGYRELINIFR